VVAVHLLAAAAEVAAKVKMQMHPAGLLLQHALLAQHLQLLLQPQDQLYQQQLLLRLASHLLPAVWQHPHPAGSPSGRVCRQHSSLESLAAPAPAPHCLPVATAGPHTGSAPHSSCA
jgi:hypothetical protein